MKMDSLSFFVWLALLLIALQYLFLRVGRRKRLPPGPVPLPIVGNIFNLRGEPLKTLTELARIYGPLMSLRLGHLTVLVVSSVSMANEVLRKNDNFVSTRPVGDALRAHHHHELSLICLPVGDRWRTLRKICNTQIFSRSKLEASHELRQRKAEELVSYIHKCCKDRVTVDIGQVAFTAALNFLSNALFSFDLADHHKSDTSRDLKQLIWSIGSETSKPNVVDFFPMLRRLDPQGVRRRTEALLSRLLGVIGAAVKQRLLESPAEGIEIGRNSDLLDALLQQNSDQGLENPNITHFFMDLLVAGLESISGTVEWAMAELLRQPEKLTRLKEELHQVFGKDNSFQETNISALPYFEAVIKETFRLHPIIALVPRQADIEIEIRGYRVPKNSRIWINMYAMGRDPRVWENPDSFEPERFLRTGIEAKALEIIPFGGGRRICPALPLAMRMVPLIVGSLVHSFDWELEDGADALGLDMDHRLGITMLKAQPLNAIPIRI